MKKFKKSMKHLIRYLKPFLFYNFLILLLQSNLFAQNLLSNNTSIQTKIYFGQQIDPTLSPVITMDIDTSEGTFNCTGSLISKRKILTAAHCLSDAIIYSIGVNFENVAYLYADSYKVSPNYNSSKLTYDLAIVRLSEDAPSQVIPLSISPKKPKRGSTLYVYGYGEDEFGDYGIYKGATMTTVRTTNTKIYALGGGNACYGDSGGPAIYQYHQSNGLTKYGIVGITSYGSEDCFNLDTTFTSTLSTRAKKFIKKYGK